MSTGRTELLRQDEEARALAHTQFDAPLVVEAGAGTGKTALLTARVVAWGLGPGWERHQAAATRAQTARRVIEGVVAITFTEAAAAEMAERVGLALAELAEGDTPAGLQPGLLAVSGQELEARCLALAEELHRLPAMTIHSFCHRLLRAYPLEAGLHPAFEVDADGSRVESVVEEVVLEALHLARGAPLEDWQVLAAAGVGPPQVAAAVARLASAGITAADLGQDPLAPGQLARLGEELRDAVAAVLGAEDGCLAAGTPVSVHTLGTLRALDELLRREQVLADGNGLAAAASVVDAGALRRLADWGKGKLTATDRRLLAGRAAWLGPAAARLGPVLANLAGLRPRELTAARGVVGSLLAAVSGRLVAEGVATYAELLHGAQRLLASSARLRAEVRRGIDQLLVDEFQDTDHIQCDIVARLALEGGAAERPGLFIVGDPKQSIYAWRGADLAAYDTFKEQILSHGGLVRPLVRNFRSVAPILAEVERVVGPVMEERHGVQPPFQPLEPTADRAARPGFDRQEWTSIEHWLAWPDDESGEPSAAVKVAEATAVEAAMVAADILRLHDEGGVPWGKVGVLLRTTTEQETVLERFRAAGVPFEVAREREYFRQREVVEAAALVRTLLEPTDQLALLTILRSDAVGVPDAALAPLFESGLPAFMADVTGPGQEATAALESCLERARVATPADLPGANALPDWPATARAALETVLVLRRSLRHDPPDLFVERMRTLWLAEVTAGARYLGRFRRARLERFYAQLEESLATAAGGLAALARFLRRAVEEGREPEVPATPDTLSDAVHVMTIHGAKGLDFEHVYLLQMHRGDRGPGGGGDAEVLYGTGGLEYRLFGWATPGWATAELERTQREAAERVRLLYVAMTRAKERLVLSGRWRPDGTLVAADSAASFADLTAHRLRPEALGPLLGTGEVRLVEAGGQVQWVVPKAMAPIPDRAPAAAPPAVVAADGVAAEAARLAHLRKAAAARRSLPLGATVTGLVHPEDEETAHGGRQPDGRDRVAAAIGSVVHLLLETLDLGGDPASGLAERREEARARLAAAVTASERGTALQRLDGLLDRLGGGACLARLGELAPSVVARELPLLLPPFDDRALGFVTGTADLVYVEDGAPVVVDYKTDRVTDEEALAERVELYRPQLALYARALREALALGELPATELWFLHADRIVRL